MTDIAGITSKDNRRLVELRKLRDGALNDRIFLEGRRLVAELLRSPLELDELYFSDSFTDRELITKLIERVGFAAEIPARIFGTIADTRTPQGIIVTARRPAFSLDDLNNRITAGSLPLVVMLENVNNPANLGAIARSAEAADAAGLVVTCGSADAFSPKAIRAAMGSNLRLPTVTGISFGEAVDWAVKNGLTLTRTDVRAGLNYTEINWTLPRLLVFGSEAHGIGANVGIAAFESVGILMRNGVESLNLGVSAGVILFEARRQNL